MLAPSGLLVAALRAINAISINGLHSILPRSPAIASTVGREELENREGHMCEGYTQKAKLYFQGPRLQAPDPALCSNVPRCLPVAVIRVEGASAALRARIAGGGGGLGERGN